MHSRSPFAAGLAFTLVLALASVQALAQTWRKQEYPADGFSVEFSGQVKVDPTDVAPDAKERIIRSTNYLQDDGASAYIVGATLAKYSVEFDKGVTASFNALQCKTKTNDMVLTFPRGKAREISATDCSGDGSLAMEARYFQVGNWFYQVMAIYTKDGSTDGPRRFITSFAAMDAPGAPATK